MEGRKDLDAAEQDGEPASDRNHHVDNALRPAERLPRIVARLVDPLHRVDDRAAVDDADQHQSQDVDPFLDVERKQVDENRDGNVLAPADAHGAADRTREDERDCHEFVAAGNRRREPVSHHHQGAHQDKKDGEQPDQNPLKDACQPGFDAQKSFHGQRYPPGPTGCGRAGCSGLVISRRTAQPPWRPRCRQP